MHQSQEKLVQELATAKEQVSVGNTYYHYKDPTKFYKVLGLAVMEADDSLCVLYEAQYGEQLIFVRPLSSWLEEVDWQDERVQRFTLVKD